MPGGCLIQVVFVFLYPCSWSLCSPAHVPSLPHTITSCLHKLRALTKSRRPAPELEMGLGEIRAPSPLWSYQLSCMYLDNLPMVSVFPRFPDFSRNGCYTLLWKPKPDYGLEFCLVFLLGGHLTEPSCLFSYIAGFLLAAQFYINHTWWLIKYLRGKGIFDSDIPYVFRCLPLWEPWRWNAEDWANEWWIKVESVLQKSSFKGPWAAEKASIFSTSISCPMSSPFGFQIFPCCQHLEPFQEKQNT